MYDPHLHYAAGTSGSHRKRGAFAAVAAAAALALTSCASPTPYQPIASASATQGGYSETQIAPDLWRVTFAGNTLTSRERVEGYLLYRAAELTLERGEDWFEIVGRETEREVREEVRRDPFYDPYFGYYYWRPRWSYFHRPYGWRHWDPYWGDPFFETREVDRYVVSAEIEMHSGPTPEDGRRIFDANEVIERLGPTIERPQD